MSDLTNNGGSQSSNIIFSSEEVLALKVLAAEPRKGFWRDYSLLISLCAFLLSFTTAVISAYIGYKRDVHDQLGELSTALRSLQELNLKQMELSEKYAGSVNESNPAIDLLGNQMYSATIGAADIAFRVGTHATTAIIIPISQNLYTYGQYSRAEALAEVGLDAARTFEDEAVALRWLGLMKIRAGTAQSIAEGNQLFLRASNFEQRYGPVRDLNIASFTRALVQLDWSEALAAIDCDQARKHFSDGVQILNSAGSSGDLDKLRRIVSGRLTRGIGSITSCMPSSDVVLTK